MSRKGRQNVQAVAIAVGSVLPTFACLVSCLWGVFDDEGQGPYRSHYDLGLVHVIGGPDEAWVFIEKWVYAERPGSGSGGRRSTSVGSEQQVVVFTPDGVNRTIPIPTGLGITFHPNISRVLRQQDGFYLMRGESMGRHASLFRWQDNHFALLPLEAHHQFLKDHGLEHSRLPEFDPALDRLTEANGWRVLLAVDRGPAPSAFEWNGRRFEMGVVWGPPETKLQLRCTDPARAWEAVILSFDPTSREITPDEYEALWKRKEPGYPKPVVWPR
jgi:hypothetical protein